MINFWKMVFLMKIGVIAIQGAVSEHVDALKKALAERGVEAEVVAIKHKGIVPECSGIVIPGGESTTLCRLLAREGIAEEIKEAAARGVPILGTCAGLIVLAKEGDRAGRKDRAGIARDYGYKGQQERFWETEGFF